MKWNLTLLSAGTVGLSFTSSLKLTGWAEDNLKTDVASAITEAIRCGISLRLVVPVQTLKMFHSPDYTRAWITPPYLSPGYSDALLPPTDDTHIGWEQYRERLQGLFARPHAVAFLLRGGIAWRLALEFGPKDLSSRLAHGVSTSMTDHYRGCSELQGQLGDDVSPSELALLCGACRGDNKSDHLLGGPIKPQLIATWERTVNGRPYTSSGLPVTSSPSRTALRAPNL